MTVRINGVDPAVSTWYVIMEDRALSTVHVGNSGMTT